MAPRAARWMGYDRSIRRRRYNRATTGIAHASRAQVDVVGHQAIRPDFHAALSARLGHQLEIGVIIVLLEEGHLPAVAALRGMVRIARNNNSCDACHAGNLVKTRQPVNRKLVW